MPFDHARCPSCNAVIDPQRLKPGQRGQRCPTCDAELGIEDIIGVAAAFSEDDTQRQLVGDLLNRAFDGAAGKLVLRALEDGKVTPDELTEIRRLLNKRNGGVS